MRYLNKIIFINSAKTPYAEICMDGNVHLIGTQGVGKSTLLRAILFFYNGDKTKLGIEPGRQPFDAYYFPYDNSYIVYEVVRETGPYCVIAVKSGGKTAFRFLSGSYNREHFINTAGEALVWEAVRKNLDLSGALNRKVERYGEYRDILYGNTAEVPAAFRKYALLESRQYQNIPRTIQNVFLNSKLEAKFIKQTIIKSLNEEDIVLDLNKYSQHLSNFENELNDILKWSEKSAGTVAPVRKLAVTIAEAANMLHQNALAGTTIREVIAAAWDAVLEAQPKVMKAIAVENEKVEGAQRRWSEYAKRSHAAKQLQLKEAGINEYKLKDAKQKEAVYAHQNIEDVIARAAKSADLNQLQQTLTEELALLTKTFSDVAAKYREQISQAEAQLQRFEEGKERERLKGENSRLEEGAKITQDYSHLLAQAATAHDLRRQEAGAAVDAGKETLNRRESEKREAQLRRPLEAEIEVVRAQIAVGKLEENTLQSTLKITALQIEQVNEQSRQALEKSEAAIEQKHQSQLTGITVLDSAISKIETMLAQSESSFYDWLCTEMPNWENTIGKVIDEESVLFNQNLSPAHSAGSTADFFGISIDLTAISKTVKTRADYEAEVVLLKKQRAAAVEAIESLNALKVEEATSIRRKFLPQTAKLNEAKKKAQYELQQLAGTQRKSALELTDLESSAVLEKECLLAQSEAQLSAARETWEGAKSQLAARAEKAFAEDADLRKARDKKVKEEAAKWESAFVHIRESIQEQQAQTGRKIKGIKAQESNALQDVGADVKRLHEVESSLQQTKEQLRKIAAEATLLSEYNKDKRELFDQAPNFLASKKQAEEAAQAEEDKLLRRQTAYGEEIAELHSKIKVLQVQAERFATDLEEALNFQQEAGDFDKSHFPAGKTAVPNRRLKDLCQDAIKLRYQRDKSMLLLQVDATSFAAHFPAKNLFNFPTSFPNEAAYLLFAGELQEFIEEDKIAVLEQQVNARYADLIRLIGKETADLISKSGEIQKVITKINRDFEERAFAGVIKSIRLQLSPSTDTLVCLLEEINRFNDEHNMNTGAVNLFTTGNLEAQNETAVKLLKTFAQEIPKYGESQITLANTFELQFRIVENDNDSGWQQQISKVGSEGTDVLVKAMINIMLLNVFKEKASGRFSDFKLHCMMDEIGRLHPTNVQGILKFANDRNILLINCSPTSYNATDYKYTYLLRKDAQSNTSVRQLVKNSALS